MNDSDVFQCRLDELEASWLADHDATRRQLETLYHIPVLPLWLAHTIVACYAAPLVIYIIALVFYG